MTEDRESGDRSGERAADDLDARVAQMRDQGASWLDIQRVFGLSRQQARYAYQRAKREERRSHRRST